jgi:septum formation protein
MIPPMTELPHTVTLASASPRRRRLIGWLGFTPRVTSVETPEDLSSPLAADPPRLAEAIAAEKAHAARNEGAGADLVLAFDTVVVHEGRVLGKPADIEDAWHMLRELSGEVHEVTTGVALFAPGAEAPLTFPVTTLVSMRALDGARIATWLASGEALGCAGAYNIEHHLASVADEECYQNVAGMPLCHLYAALAGGAVGPPPEGLTPPFSACNAALGRRCQLGPRVCGTAKRFGEQGVPVWVALKR